MGRRSEDDRDAIDQAFAEIVAGYDRTADDRELNWQDSAAIEFQGEFDGEPEPPPEAETPSEAESQGKSLPELNTAWADEHPLFRFEPPPEPEAPEEPEERFIPEPPPPLERPAWPVLLGWLGMAYAVLALLATALGVRLPTWAGWLAVIGFVGAVTILVVRLPAVDLRTVATVRSCEQAQEGGVARRALLRAAPGRTSGSPVGPS